MWKSCHDHFIKFCIRAKRNFHRNWIAMGLAWCRHQMETFSALLALCEGNSPVTGEFPSQWPVTPSFDVFFDLCLNKQLSDQSWGWWFETPSRSLWRHFNGDIAVVFSFEFRHWTLRTKDCQFDSFVVAGGTVSCHYDNLRCHQSRQSCPIDDRLFSMNVILWCIPRANFHH